MDEIEQPKAIGVVISLLAIAMAVYHLVSSQVLLYSLDQHKNTHLGFALILVFMTCQQKCFW